MSNYPAQAALPRFHLFNLQQGPLRQPGLSGLPGQPGLLGESVTKGILGPLAFGMYKQVASEQNVFTHL